MGLVRAGIAVFLTALAIAPAAQAAQRYAAPAGAGATCSQAAPCSLKEAISKAKANDEVIVGGGTYTTTESINSEFSANNLYVHGDFGGAPPRVNKSAGSYAIAVTGPGSRLAYLDVSSSGSGAISVICTEGVTAERVRADSAGEGSSGILASGICAVRDSVALATGTNSVGLNISGVTGGKTLPVRNVTAIAAGTGSKGIFALCIICFTESIKVDLRNTIASGLAADLESSSSATIIASHSNFDKAVPITPGSIVDAGGNQTAPPAFVDALAGNYREAAGSPTIDAGLADGQIGTLDPDGNARVLGSAPDIGAFEFVPPPVPVAAPGEIQSLAVAPKAFKPVNAGGAILSARKKAKAPVSTTVTYNLSAAATVSFGVERKLVGRKAGKRCVKKTKANKAKKKCPLFKKVKGGFSNSGVAGANKFKFSGRLSKALPPGAYRLTGKTSTASRKASFRIVK